MSKTTSSAADRAGPGRGRQPDHAVGKAPAGNSSWHRLATFTPRNAAEIDRQLGPGQALDAGLKGRMEGVLASPLGEVRIHKDTEGQGLTGSVGAEAFALGHHVAFSADAYRPGTPLGDALIAHELAHVAQQRGAMGPEGSTAEAAAEADADRSMWGLFSGRGTAPRHRSGLSLRRCSGSPTTLPVAQAKFHSNNTLAGLYEVIDTGASKHKGSPFDGMAQDKARELSAELIGKEAASRSASLTSVLTWVKGNPTAYPP